MSIVKDSALVSIDGTVIVISMVVAGVVASRWQIIDKTSAESLSKLIVKILLPCLLFTSMILSFSVSALQHFGILFVFSSIHIFVGIFIGWIAAKILRSKRDIRRLMMNCIGFQNTTAVPLIFAKALGSDNTTSDDKNFTEDATNVVLVYTVFVTVYKWTISYNMMKKNKRVDEKLIMNSSQASALTNHSEVKEGGCWWTVKKTMNAPLYATLIAIILALIPYSKEYVLSGPDSVFGKNVFHALVVLGSAVSPLINIVLGCNLSQGYPPGADIRWSEIVAIIVGKEILMPILGFSLAWLAYNKEIISRVTALMVMVLYSGPTSMQLLMICTTHKNQVENISKVYLVMYATAAIPLAFWTMGFLVVLYN